MTTTFSHEALWLKAKLFMNYAMDPDEQRTFDERALWASLSFELLAKAALSKHSPLLIADIREDGIDLLTAAGLIPGENTLITISAKTVMSRCHLAFRPFRDAEAMAIIRNRNEYLHTGKPNFTDIPEAAWWPRYWAQVRILVNALDLEIADLVGPKCVAKVEAYLVQNRKNIEERVEMLIARAKQAFERKNSGIFNRHEAAVWDRQTSLRQNLGYSAAEPCPACNGVGLLEGEDVLDSNVQVEQSSDDDYDAWLEVTVASDYFSCPVCHLVLDGFELISQTKISESFKDVGDIAEHMEPEYGND